MKITLGWVLREIRVRQGMTLGDFCIKRKVDAIRYGLIERDELKPDWSEVNEYLDLIKKSK